MSTLTALKTMSYEAIMNSEPSELHQIVNQYGQTITFYEHPKYGDASTVLGVVEGHEIAFDTDFWDCGDFTDDSDYLPVLYDGKVYCYYQLDNPDLNLIGK